MPASSRGITKPECMGRLTLNDNSASDANVALGQKRTSYSITSVACATSVVGTVMPSALAVLRFITSSNLVGCCTGRSAGFAPSRILAT